MELSGVQLLVKAMAPLGENEKLTPLPKIEFEEAEEHHCAICGGLLTKDHTAMHKAMSGKWTSQAELEAKDEDNICAACLWVMTLNNRINYLPNDSSIHIFDEDGRRAVAINQEFVDYLKQDITKPTILAVSSSYERMKKHTVWKLNKCVTNSSRAMKVALFDYGFGGNDIEGTAQFDARDMLDKIQDFKDLYVGLMNDQDFASKFGKKNIKVKKGICMNKVKKSLVKRRITTPEIILAARTAANIVFVE